MRNQHEVIMKQLQRENPVAPNQPLTVSEAAQREETLAEVLAARVPQEAVPMARAKPSRMARSSPAWRLVVAACFVFAVAFASVLYQVADRDAVAPAYAATPPMLIPIERDSSAGQPLLQQLAERALGQAGPQAGAVLHSRYASWSLATRVEADGASSVVEPTLTDIWIAPDGRARVVEAEGPPVESVPSTIDLENGAGFLEDAASEDSFESGELGEPSRLPSEKAALRKEIAESGSPTTPFSIQVLTALFDRLRYRPLEPGLLAAMYSLLADEPDVRNFQAARDRYGRQVAVLGVDSAYGGLPSRVLLLVDEATALPLGSERILTSDAGALNVRVPAVTSYTSFLAAGPVSSDREQSSPLP